MPDEKYFDWARRRAIGEADGCPFEEWPDRQGAKLFALHPNGFRVFLPPEALEASDEYGAGDPYSVETHIDNAFHRRRFQCTLELLKLRSPREAQAWRILDLGCGEGHITAEMKKSYPRAEVSGLDYAISAIRTAAERHKDIDFIVADAYDAPYAPNYFDVIVCNNLWEHVPDPLRFLRGASRILKPGGALIISTPSRYRLENLLRVLRGKPVRFMSRLHVTEYSVGQVTEQLRHGGFLLARTYSTPLDDQSAGSLKQWVALRIVQPVVRLFLRSVGSHHCLESTVFYLAEKKEA
jgi:ubiquinone/menaquinone biosynthesis C-methylase UbiE